MRTRMTLGGVCVAVVLCSIAVLAMRIPIADDGLRGLNLPHMPPGAAEAAPVSVTH